jgi:hypothetical protein
VHHGAGDWAARKVGSQSLCQSGRNRDKSKTHFKNWIERFRCVGDWVLTLVAVLGCVMTNFERFSFIFLYKYCSNDLNLIGLVIHFKRNL